ncbi:MULTISPECIES: LEA type 2 family protein [unclassified Sorangium]|uniref:LEA type 2 family protein n=1 Tax=unclassified Sorangium TaxID=2621164 RepID=UPI003F5EBE1B
MPFPRKTNPLRRLPALALALAALTAIAGAACVSKPTMQLDHAEITGIRIAFPPSLGILMTIVVNVHNPNSYDVAVRAVRGQVVLAGRYPLAVDFRADGDGVWLASDRTTQVRVPVSVPVDLGFQLLRETLTSPVIPYRFSGRADVTATRTFRLEADDYSIDDHGVVARNQIETALGILR